MQFKNLVAILPFVLGMVSAAPAAAENFDWSAFLYHTEKCSESGGLVGEARGHSGEQYYVRDYAGVAGVRSIQMQWNSANPPVESGITAISSYGRNNTGDLFNVGSGYGSVCIKAERDYLIDGFKSESCALSDCRGEPTPGQ